jgi:predicted RNA binding protein YcfA (HicA-like mRNA interferase family)
MSKLPVVSGDETIRALMRVEYEVVRRKGSHVRLRCPTGQLRGPVTVPAHRTLKPGTLRAILRDARLSVEEFVELLER